MAVCLNFDLFPCGYIDSAICHRLASSGDGSGDWNPLRFRSCLVSLRRPLVTVRNTFRSRYFVAAACRRVDLSLRVGHTTYKTSLCRFCSRRHSPIHHCALRLDRSFGLTIQVSDGRPPVGDGTFSPRRTHPASSRTARALRAFSGKSRPLHPFRWTSRVVNLSGNWPFEMCRANSTAALDSGEIKQE